MSRSPAPTALLELPSVAGSRLLRAGLMALRVLPGSLPLAQADRRKALAALQTQSHAVAFIDVSPGETTAAPRPGAVSLLELDASVPRNGLRNRIFLTRLQHGHVSPSDRRWVKALGFADLWPEFDAGASEGHLRDALDAVARALQLAPLAAPELARYASAMNERDGASPRAVIRKLTGGSAEALVERLQRSLAIEDRRYRLRSYPHCFVGDQAVAWMQQHMRCSAEAAVQLGQALAALGLLVHVTHEHDFRNEALFYRLAWSAKVDAMDLGDYFHGLRGPAGVSVADRSYLGKNYPQCWVGSEAVDHLTADRSMSRFEAWLVLHRLMQFGLIEHVVHERPFIDGNFYYRFAYAAGS
jgi:Domain found in Dishevelled, Egl-10, and Pleckstrin (DEP)